MNSNRGLPEGFEREGRIAVLRRLHRGPPCAARRALHCVLLARMRPLFEFITGSRLCKNAFLAFEQYDMADEVESATLLIVASFGGICVFTQPRPMPAVGAFLDSILP